MRGVWHHHDRRRRGPRELTGIADLTRGKEHPTARLLDLVPGRSGTVYKNGGPSAEKTSAREYESRHWTPSRDSKNAIALACSKDATSVPSSHSPVMPQVRCAVASSKTRPDTADAQGDPLYHIRLLLRASREGLTKRQQERLREAFTADEAHK